MEALSTLAIIAEIIGGGALIWFAVSAMYQARIRDLLKAYSDEVESAATTREECSELKDKYTELFAELRALKRLAEAIEKENAELRVTIHNLKVENSKLQRDLELDTDVE